MWRPRCHHGRRRQCHCGSWERVRECASGRPESEWCALAINYVDIIAGEPGWSGYRISSVQASPLCPVILCLLLPIGAIKQNILALRAFSPGGQYCLYVRYGSSSTAVDCAEEWEHSGVAAWWGQDITSLVTERG